MTFEFLKMDKELIAIYTPAYGADEILKKIEISDGYNIKNVFWVEKNDLRELEEYDEDSICFAIGVYIENYVEIRQEVAVTRHKFFFSEDIKFNQKIFVANRNVSILRKIDEVVDGDIYIGGDNQEEFHYIPYGEFKALIELFPNSSEMTKYVHKRIATLVKEFIPQCDKYEYIYEKYIKEKESQYINKYSEDNLSFNKKIKLEQFKVALEELKSLLEEEHIGESIWQKRIQNIIQLLYPQYILFAREITFNGIDGNDKRPDFILVDANGFVDIMEIKVSTVDVLSKKPSYRNNYVPSREFAGIVQQMEKYVYCLNVLNREKSSFFTKLSRLLPNGIIPQVVNPQGILLLGRSNNFDEQQTRDFELIKRQYKNVADIMTYDDLIARFERIILALSDEMK